MEKVDVLIIGGSFAGMSLGLFLANARRNVAIIDKSSSGNRNAGVPHSNNVLGINAKPDDVLQEERARLKSMPFVKWVESTVTDIKTITGPKYQVFVGETVFECKKLVFATGCTDILPDIPNCEQFWKTHLFQCPYCSAPDLVKGDTLPDIAVMSDNEEQFMMAKIVHKWGKTCVLFTQGRDFLSEEQKKELGALTVRIITSKIVSLHQGSSADVVKVELDDGQNIEIQGLFVHMPWKLNALDLLAKVGITEDTGGLTQSTNMQLISVDSVSFESTVAKNVFAVGDCATMFQKVPVAAGMAFQAGFLIDHALSMEPVEPDMGAGGY